MQQWRPQFLAVVPIALLFFGPSDTEFRRGVRGIGTELVWRRTVLVRCIAGCIFVRLG
jgi:hypothetical protein